MTNIVGLDGRTIEANPNPPQPEAPYFPSGKDYIFTLKNGETYDASGVLVMTTAFAAVITSPTDYALVVPLDALEAIVSTEEDEVAA